MQLSTEILNAMLRGANPLFLVGLIAEHERHPLAVQAALREASNAFYTELEKKYEHEFIFNKVRNKDHGNIDERIRRQFAGSRKNIAR